MSITVGNKIKVIKGNRSWNINKGANGVIISITPDMGIEFSHFCKLTIQFNAGTHTFWVRHVNRLSDPTCNLHKGDPHCKIVVSVSQ